MPYKDKEKQKLAQAASFQRRKAELVERNRQQRLKRRRVVSERKLELGCSKCGYNKCAAALDAHHPNKKDGAICEMIQACRSIEDIMTELGKCEILCANCHRELHLALSSSG